VDDDASGDAAGMLAALIEGKGEGRYGLSDVNQREHALQAAWLAERSGCDAALIVAALLHDIGHMVHDLGENPAGEGIDDRHEQTGYDFLRHHFGSSVTEPVRLHVAAKRYLCAAEPDYFGRLSPDSVLSLSLQGGPMDEREAAAFAALPHACAAVQLRRFDEAAKATGLVTPAVGHFLPYLRTCLTRGAG
jgi:phosphonate degradation associated HDIG domain protein